METQDKEHLLDITVTILSEQYTLRSRGDKFMMQIEPIAAKVPYHVIPGNHE